LKFTIYRYYAFGKLILTEDIVIECIGAGTKENPLIIESSKRIPENFFLKDSKIYLKIKNLKSNHISLLSCINVSVEDCHMNKIYIIESHDIDIRNSIIQFLKISKSSHVFSTESSFERVKIKNSLSQVSFKECTINRIKRNSCKSIFLENTRILNPYRFKSLKYLVKDNKRTLYYCTGIPILIILLITLIFYYNPLFIIAIFLMIIIIYYLGFREQRKVKKRKEINEI
jgi:hypothetical protein